MSQEKKKLSTEKPQYHYFYGSTDESMAPHHSTRDSMGLLSEDGQSLIGEELLPTDTELDLETNEKADLQHLIVTNKNGGVHPILGNGSDMRARNIFEFCTLERLRDTHPLLLVFLLIASICIVFFTLTVALFPDSGANASHITEADFTLNIPFKAIDRAEYGDPLSGIVDTSLFDASLLHKGVKGGDPRHQFIFPFPTGAFWTNLVMASTKEGSLSYPIAVYPYAYKWSPTQLQVSYPARHREEDSKSIRDYFFPDLTFETEEQIGSRRILKFDPLSVSLRFDIDREKYLVTHLVQGSPYITLIFKESTPVIRAFSIFSQVFCPRDDQTNSTRRRLEYGICYIANNGNESTATGVQFLLQSQEGMKYILFSSEPITLVFDQQSKTTVRASKRFSGVIRLAYIPAASFNFNSTDTISISASTGLQRLIYHSQVYPTGAEVSWSFRDAESLTTSSSTTDHSNDRLKRRRHLSKTESTSEQGTVSGASSPQASTISSGRIGSLHFEYATQTVTPTSSASKPKPLLMLGLPHHIQSVSTSLQLSPDKFDIEYTCIKGPMRPILGASWSYDEILPTIGIDKLFSSNSSAVSIPMSSRSIILDSLEEDVDLLLPTVTENVYGFGKQSARLAQIAHIARRLQSQNGTVTIGNVTTLHQSRDELDLRATAVLEKATKRLHEALDSFFNQKVSDNLLYDANFGGVVTKDGLLDAQADFGNGRYNDHHFHYGYILYASALMGSLNKTFLATHGPAVDALFYDIAYYKNLASGTHDGVYFPGARHKVWFDGHSFASGLFPFANGKSQESSSEAVNAYYGAYLWSLVKHSSLSRPLLDTSQQTDFARLLLATELRGARTYWHMIPANLASNGTLGMPSTVYSTSFLRNFMVGNLGMMDAVCNTWFGSATLYVNMINFMPVTAITADLFDQRFVMRQYGNVLAPLGETVEMAWRGYVVSNHAIIDPNAAWTEALALKSSELDSGISKSQILYWVATRPGFKPGNTTRSNPNATMTTSNTSTISTMSYDLSANDDASCASHSKCTSVGLTGACCPSASGAMLECCT